MLKHGRLIFCAAAVLLAVARIALGQVIRLEDFKPTKDGIPGEQSYQQTIDIGPNVKIDATVEATVRRNGTLRVANLKLKVLDEYDDGSMYVGGLLHVEFTDISGDGLKDLVITGTVANTGDKESDPVTYSTVTSIYIFDSNKKEFRLAFHHGPKLD